MGIYKIFSEENPAHSVSSRLMIRRKTLLNVLPNRELKTYNMQVGYPAGSKFE
jgi:hypothetical protein